MPISKLIAAAVQAAPVFFDRDATIEKVTRLVKEAAAGGAGLIVFPEAFVPGYPDWVWRSTPWSDQAWYERLYEEGRRSPGAGDGGPRRRRSGGFHVLVDRSE